MLLRPTLRNGSITLGGLKIKDLVNDDGERSWR
jgi:hypothetical protein